MQWSPNHLVVGLCVSLELVKAPVFDKSGAFKCSGRRRGSGSWSGSLWNRNTDISAAENPVSPWVPSALQRLADTNLDCFSLKGCLPLVLTVSPRAVGEESEASGRGAELSRKGAVRLNCRQACAHSQGI